MSRENDETPDISQDDLNRTQRVVLYALSCSAREDDNGRREARRKHVEDLAEELVGEDLTNRQTLYSFERLDDIGLVDTYKEPIDTSSPMNDTTVAVLTEDGLSAVRNGVVKDIQQDDPDFVTDPEIHRNLIERVANAEQQIHEEREKQKENYKNVSEEITKNRRRSENAMEKAEDAVDETKHTSLKLSNLKDTHESQLETHTDALETHEESLREIRQEMVPDIEQRLRAVESDVDNVEDTVEETEERLNWLKNIVTEIDKRLGSLFGSRKVGRDYERVLEQD